MRVIFAPIFVTSVLAAVTYSLRVEDVIPNLHRCTCESYTVVCLWQAIESMKSYLANGIPDLHVISFDPFFPGSYYKLLLKDNGTLRLVDISVRGLSNFTTSHIIVNRNQPYFYVNLTTHFPNIHIRANGYKNIGIDTSITGDGDRRIDDTFEDVTVDIKLSATILWDTFEEEEIERLHLNNISIDLKIKDIEKHMKYFKVGHNATAQTIIYNGTINGVENLKIVEDSIKGTILNYAAKVIQIAANNMFTRLPKETLCQT